MIVKKGREEIRLLAMDSRRTLDVEDDEHVEFDLDLYIEKKLGKRIFPVKNLKKDFGIDSFWTNDFEYLIIDKDCYETTTNHRSRFTLAHEIGHYFLHQKEQSQYDSTDKWLSAISSNTHLRNIYEQEANYFASNFLISDECLIKELESLKKRLDVKTYLENNVYSLEVISQMYSHVLASAFHVSQKVMEIRLENYWK